MLLVPNFSPAPKRTLNLILNLNLPDCCMMLWAATSEELGRQAGRQASRRTSEQSRVKFSREQSQVPNPMEGGRLYSH